MFLAVQKEEEALNSKAAAAAVAAAVLWLKKVVCFLEHINRCRCRG